MDKDQVETSARINSRKLRNSTKFQKNLFITISLLSILGILGIFTIYPIFKSLDISLRDWNLIDDEHPYNNFENYSWAFEDDTFWISLKNSVYFTVVYMVVCITHALVLAELIFTLKRPWKDIFTIIIFLPVMTSLIAVSMIFRDLFSVATGPLNYLIQFIGLGPFNYLNDPNVAMNSIIGVSVWKYVGIYFVIILSGLSTIPTHLLDAASIDGASKFQSYIYIKLPLLVPTLIYVLVTGTITSLQVFGQIFVLTGGGPGTATRTLVIHLYENGFRFFDMGRASAIAFMLLVFVLIITIAYLKGMREQFEY